MLRVENVTYRYRASALNKGAEAPSALHHVSLRVASGERVALIGANGSGKSTLAALLNGMRLPNEGSVAVDGLRTDDPSNTVRVRSLVGVVRQDPALQLVATVVRDDVAFGPTNLGLPEDEVERRVGRALELVGLSACAQAETAALSGGQQQRVALAGVLAMEPRYLVLDEVTAMLDTASRRTLRAQVDELCAQGVGIVQITHDALEALTADRVVVLDRGRVLWEGEPALLACQEPALLEGTLLLDRYARRVVEALQAGYDARTGLEPEDLAAWCVGRGAVPADEGVPAGGAGASARGGREAPTGSWGGAQADGGRERPARNAGGTPARRTASAGASTRIGDLAAEDAGFSYGEHRVLMGCDLAARAGRRVLIAGVSGAGKSTLALLLAGLEKPDAGTVRLGGKAPAPGDVGMVFQRPEDQLFLDTVREDIAFGPRNLGLSEDEVARRVEHAREQVGLGEELMERHPVALSGGQARRAALAGIAALEPGAYVLDEPTAGLDVAGRRFLHRFVDDAARRGLPVAVLSHDLDEWVDAVDDVALMGEGRIAWAGTARALRGHPERFAAVGLEPPAYERFIAACRALRAEGGSPCA